MKEDVHARVVPTNIRSCPNASCTGGWVNLFGTAKRKLIYVTAFFLLSRDIWYVRNTLIL